MQTEVAMVITHGPYYGSVVSRGVGHADRAIVEWGKSAFYVLMSAGDRGDAKQWPEAYNSVVHAVWAHQMRLCLSIRSHPPG